MKIFFAILFLIISFSVKSQPQPGYAIEFNRAGMTTNYDSYHTIRYVYNDSFAFQYFIYEYDPFKKKNVYSKKLKHHTTFINKITFLIYNEVNYHKKYLIVDTIKATIWKPIVETKVILGYTCKGALQVSSTNDSTLIWYTEALGTGVGFLHFNFDLGQPLEIFEQKTNIRYYATKIERGNYRFNLPKAKMYSIATYQKMIQ